MKRYYFRPWKDDTLISALHFMRCQIVRDGLEGLAHVDGLLRLRGIDPASLPMPDKRPKHFARGKLRIAILDALRNGPMTGADLARHVQGNALDYAAAYKRVYQCLNHMQGAGLVRREGRLWGRPDVDRLASHKTLC
jgi:hypothetical protein